MSSRVRKILLLSIVAGLFAAAAFAFSRGTLPPADFTFGNGSEPKTLDPQNTAEVPGGRIVWELYEGLCRWDPKTLEARPGVAESWEASADGLTYTFHLRDNAKWTDGTPITADDFVWSFRRFLSPAMAAEYAYEMWYLVNAEKYTKMKAAVGDPVEIELLEQPEGALPFAAGKLLRGTLVAIEESPAAKKAKERNGGKTSSSEKNADGEDAHNENDDKVLVVQIDGKERRFCKGGTDGEDYKWLLFDFDHVGVKALDPHTIEFKLEHPVPYFAMLTGFYPLSPVNRRCIETYGPNWVRPENIVTNGPFKLQSRRVRDRIRLVKSDTYWDRDKVKLNIIDALAVESETTTLNMYLTGQLDFMADYLPGPVIEQLRKSGRSDYESGPYLGTYFYRINVTRKPFNDARVRRAINLATDKRAIVEHVAKAGQMPARSLVPPVLTDYVPYKSQECGDYNVEEARRLLAEAGYPGGKGFPKIGLLFNPVDLHSGVAQVFQAQMRENLGIEVELQQQEFAACLMAQRRLDYDLARLGWIGDYPDPTTFLKLFITGGGNNQTGYSNPQYDRLVSAAENEPDLAKRMEFFQKAERIVMDDMPFIPIYFYVTTNMKAPYVKGIYANVQNVHPLKEAWVDKDEKAKFNAANFTGVKSTESEN
jgi:oligopeptide transport system substrate-binding protein